jgi:transcription antitermination factor NusG
MDHWYAVWTRARHEFAVRDDLGTKGFEVFLPTVERASVRRDRKKVLTVPLFPNYVFARASLDREQHLAIVRTLGVVNILGYGEHKDIWVPDEQIESVRILVDRQVPLAQHPYLQVGKYIRVLNGPFAGAVGIIKQVKGKRRLVVQLDLLRRAVACEIAAADVMPVETPY